MLIKFEVKRELPTHWLFLFPFKWLEEFFDVVGRECRLAKYAHDLHNRPSDTEVMLNDTDEAVCDDGNVYLNSDGVLRLAPEPLDLKVLLDSFEEKFHLPSVFVEQRDITCTEVEIVCVISKSAMQMRDIEDNPSDDAWVFLNVRFPGEADVLVFEHVVNNVEHAFPIDNFVFRFPLFSDDEECPGRIDLVKSGKVKIASVKHIASQRLVSEPVHGIDIMQLGVSDSVENGNFRGDVNLRMYLDSRFRASELCPSEYGHAEVNGRGVNGRTSEPTCDSNATSPISWFCRRICRRYV